ncbi:MAG: Gfo/Idh/MocA family oxidoreductase [Phycisphaerae bacterium]|nr:Gfo/Idh/MocA family oxidoreductase [Phycisphaerae bacterium]
MPPPDTHGPLRFALIGAAGFIAPRHMKAIKETGNTLVAALDPKDSVGIIDSYFPDAHFFTEFERFDRHVEKLRRRGTKVDCISICSPNYLHDAHIRFALRSGAHAICEKPIVLNPWNVDGLEELSRESGREIYTILQLRLHPAIISLREKFASRNGTTEVDIAYITSRGRWYHQSWKGEEQKSGGIATNIGVHFFDMLSWIFGAQRKSTVHLRREDCAAGLLELERARVRWFLSINAEHLPAAQREKGQRTYRAITMGGEAVEFSEGFTDLHTTSYRSILDGHGFRIGEARSAIEMVHDIRHAPVAGLTGDFHPLCREVAS